MKARLAVLVALLLACKKPVPTPLVEEVDGGAEMLTPVPSALPMMRDASHDIGQPRCKPAGAGVTVASGAGDIDVGDAVATKDGFVVGVTRQEDGGSIGGVAFVDGEVTRANIVDLGRPSPHAPPPAPFLRGQTTVVAYYPHPLLQSRVAGTGETRELHLVRFDGQKPEAPVVVTQGRDMSFAFDVAFGPNQEGLVVWDEDAVGRRNGDIKVATLSADMKLGPPHAVSPEGTDADQPRVAPRPGGFWIVWVASDVPDAGARGDASKMIEGVRDPTPFLWLEAVAVDEHGVVQGKPKRLTSGKGHVSLFDLKPRDGGDTLDIVARDDPARVVRITLSNDGTSTPPVAIVSDDVGDGTPFFLTSSAGAWLGFADPSDHLRLVPLDKQRVPAASASLEPLLDKGRPLAFGAGDATRLLAAFPSEESKQLRLLSCVR